MEKDTQTKLIEAATPLFANKGLAGVSIRELAEAAGVNIAAVSYYFKGKDGLYVAVLEEQFAPIAQALELIDTAPYIPPVERLTLYARHIVAIHRQRPYLIRFLHTELTNPTLCFETVVKKYLSRIYQFLYKSLQEGVAAGQFQAGLNPGYAAMSLAGIMNFYFIAKPLAKEMLPLAEKADEEYTTQAFRIFLDGIRGKEA